MCLSFPVVDVAVLTTGSLSLKEFQINRTPLHERRKESPTPELALVRSVVLEKTEMKYDSTGMFHWTPARSIEDCILVRFQFSFLMQKYLDGMQSKTVGSSDTDTSDMFPNKVFCLRLQQHLSPQLCNSSDLKKPFCCLRTETRQR